MSYKPLSQTVTNGKDKEISSSDAVFDAIAAIPASANLSLSNLTDPTAINQVLRGQNGSASAPAYSFTGDTNTGIFSSGADTLNLATAGSEKMRIDSSGNTEVGYTSTLGYFLPGYKLTVSNFATTNPTLLQLRTLTSNYDMVLFKCITSQGGWNNSYWTMQRRVDTTDMGFIRFGYGLDSGVGIGSGTTTTLFVAQNDSVGIGTSSPNFTYPLAKLHVQQTSATTNAVTNILRVDSQSSGTPATGIGVGIEMAAETAANNTEIGVVLEAVTKDITAGSEDFDFVVKIMTAGAAATEKMRVASTGVIINETGADQDTRIEGDTDANLVFVDASTDKVGIGTSTPAEKLEVNGNIKGGTISFNADANRQATLTNLGFLTATKTHDFGSITQGDEETTTITVTGAAVGDAVFVGAPSAIEANLNWCAYVSAADTVTLRLQNVASSGSIDPASATWRVTVLKT